ncbi:sensor histidine kinase TmoS [Clostridium homopropionicum DSM 5847]|uniref:histidine kinase n=1 Tax=Clostridium homopropionicum DSM 5847 TaxID=1121318 RepID=A0A0L6ZAL0_9CLOT|nr:ATP-binding protein [Clostridium homopropionicum]KOA19997.1 sensor histidine kinase TmoS [Clostridium homopropionicum DSM 5847]SFG64309.1 PAS domain S-box-containing protein [Clostridium homopropionicum]
MKGTSEVSEKNIGIMILIVKIAMIFFAEITIYKNLPNYWSLFGGSNGAFNLQAMILLICNTILIYIFWIVMRKKMIYKNQKYDAFSWIEISFFVAFLSFSMYLSNSYESEVKYIFLLLIITSVIQYGLRYGMVTTLISSFIILGFDFLYAPIINGINNNFEGDLIITGIYVFITWILGYYVDFEKEYKLRTTEQINILSNELEESHKSRHDIEEALLKNNICFEMLFENAQNAILVHKDGQIFYANERAAKLLGYENAEKLNEIFMYEHYPTEDKEKIKNKYIDICNNNLSNVIEDEDIIDYLGNAISVRNTSSFFIYEGKPAVLTFLLDISSEKQIQNLMKDIETNEKLLNETREYNALITEFLTNISHELKTPINVIYVALQTMHIYFDDYSEKSINKCKSYVNMMKQNCFRLIRLVNNLLDVTKLDSGFLTLNKVNDNIVRVVEDITLSVAAYIESKDIELIFDTDVEEKVMAFDHDKIERIILNLLSNAFKYSPSGGKILVSFQDKGSTIAISIKDEGDGVPEDKLDFIFERFGQVNKSLSRPNEGSGIGLYIVKSFVEMHGGKISVSSKEGVGSEFTIELPVEVINIEDHMKNTIFETNVERINIEFSDIYSILN